MNAREQGKLYFQKGKFSAAAEAYTEAIVCRPYSECRPPILLCPNLLPFQTLEPAVAALYQNRALCFQKLARWDDVLNDAEQALKLLENSGSSPVKALYLRGTAYLNLNRWNHLKFVTVYSVLCTH